MRKVFFLIFWALLISLGGLALASRGGGADLDRTIWLLKVAEYALLEGREEAATAPDQVHLSWRGDPTTTMTISWHTFQPTSTSTVEYGPTASYGGKATGMIETYPYGTGVIHIVELTGLEPGTLYHYRVGDEQGGWSQDRTFRTAPDGTEDFVFTVWGDMGTSEYSKQNVERAVEIEPAFHLHTGDLSYANGYQPRWDEWFRIIEPLAGRVPYMPAVGNHENERVLGEPIGFQAYLTRFALPNNERWYSFSYGNAHFIAINSEESLDEGTSQYRWLVEDLKRASEDPDLLWRIVYLHRPPYSSGSHGSSLDIRKNLESVFGKYPVDIVLTGHDHTYERTYPLRGGRVATTEKKIYRNPQGIIHVVTGGGGKSLYTFRSPKPEWSVYHEASYHFIKVTIKRDGSLHFEAIGTEDGKVFDEFWIYKIIPTKTNR